MYCKNCGTELKENARFCPMCGTMAESQENPETAAEITDTEKECVVPRVHAIISGPLTIMSTVLRVVCILFAVLVLWPGFGDTVMEETEETLELADIIFAMLLLAGSSAELPLDFILNRLRFPGEFTSLGYARKIAMSVYALAFASRLGDLAYVIRDMVVNDAAEDIYVIIVAGVLAVLSLIILIYYAVNKEMYSGEKKPSSYARKRSVKRKAKKPATFMGTIKTVVFAGFLVIVAIVAAVVIVDKKDAKKYPEYTREDMIQWLDASWQGHTEHCEKEYSWIVSDSYSQSTVQYDLDDYFANTLNKDTHFVYDVETYLGIVTSESGHLTVTADFTYFDREKEYAELSRFGTKEKALTELSDELRNGIRELWFLVDEDWVLDDIAEVAAELSNNDVHTAAEWHRWTYNLYDSADNGFRLATIEKIYDVDEKYLENCTQELEESVSEIAARINGKGYTERREIYKAVAEEIINIASYDDSTWVNTRTDNLSDEEKVKRSAHGALVTGETVCTGYAYAYKAICDELGLPCQVISGYNGDGRHSWNAIEGGLFVDCTFCDTSYSRMYMFMDKKQMDNYGYFISANQLYFEGLLQ